MPKLRALFILTAFFLTTLFSMFWQKFLLRFKLKQRKTFPNYFHRFLCRLFGIRITVIGKPIRDRGVLMVGNHASYLDILIISATARVSFVGRRDVAAWPLFGTMAKLQETVFIDRSRRSGAGESRDLIRERLREGDALVLFPEGTTTDGNRVMTFKSSLMGAVEVEMGTDAAGVVQQRAGAAVFDCLCGPARHAVGARRSTALCLVRRHGIAAASVGGTEGGSSRRGGGVPSPYRRRWPGRAQEDRGSGREDRAPRVSAGLVRRAVGRERKQTRGRAWRSYGIRCLKGRVSCVLRGYRR
jgi:1-acyl-sn-glycerol-3-phosphate acyltransferase